MLKREGWVVGKKRVYRLHRLEGLQLRMKVRLRKRISLQRGRPAVATAPNQHWSMDFVHDRMLDGRAFRVLTVIDQWSRESVSLEANFRLTGRCVGKALDQAASERGWPRDTTPVAAVGVGMVLRAIGTITFLFRPRGRAAGHFVVLGLLLLALSVPAVYAAGRLRILAFRLVAERAGPVLDAFRRYHDDGGQLPTPVLSLVPRYLSALPRGIPPLEAIAADSHDTLCPGAKCVLRADVGTGVLNWDEFLYVEVENREKCAPGPSYEKVGRWYYFHE